jgi:hypothetical protein
MISAVVWSGASCGDGWGTMPLGASESAGWFEAKVCAAVGANPRRLEEVASANIGFFVAPLGHRSELL